ncbi:MAG: OadG-related small transporter subunit [Ignavibacteriales bacterium]|nr:OadG-related small transporter subunit [Ignavibacteriales bacterium]
MFTQEVINTFWNALIITGKGMTGIFIFMGIFYLTIKLLDKLFPQEIEKTKE